MGPCGTGAALAATGAGADTPPSRGTSRSDAPPGLIPRPASPPPPPPPPPPPRPRRRPPPPPSCPPRLAGDTAPRGARGAHPRAGLPRPAATAATAASAATATPSAAAAAPRTIRACLTGRRRGCADRRRRRARLHARGTLRSSLAAIPALPATLAAAAGEALVAAALIAASIAARALAVPVPAIARRAALPPP